MPAVEKTFYVAEIGGKFGAVFATRDSIPTDTFFMVMLDTRKDRAVKRAKTARARTLSIVGS